MIHCKGLKNRTKRVCGKQTQLFLKWQAVFLRIKEYMKVCNTSRVINASLKEICWYSTPRRFHVLKQSTSEQERLFSLLQEKGRKKKDSEHNNPFFC